MFTNVQFQTYVQHSKIFEYFFYITRYNQGNVMSGPDSILVNPTLKCKRFNYTERWQGKITFWRTKKASDPLHTC